MIWEFYVFACVKGNVTTPKKMQSLNSVCHKDMVVIKCLSCVELKIKMTIEWKNNCTEPDYIYCIS